MNRKLIIKLIIAWDVDFKIIFYTIHLDYPGSIKFNLYISIGLTWQLRTYVIYDNSFESLYDTISLS